MGAGIVVSVLFVVALLLLLGRRWQYCLAMWRWWRRRPRWQQYSSFINQYVLYFRARRDWVAQQPKLQYPKDARPQECIAVARRYANGEASNEERDAAWAAAWAAGDAAAGDAAAGDAAGAAAWAAGAAAWAAGDAEAAAGAAETKWQVDRLREMLANITR